MKENLGPTVIPGNSRINFPFCDCSSNCTGPPSGAPPDGGGHVGGGFLSPQILSGSPLKPLPLQRTCVTSVTIELISEEIFYRKGSPGQPGWLPGPPVGIYLLGRGQNL